MLDTLFDKVTVLKDCNFIGKRIQLRCFSVNIAKFLRTPILKNFCKRLLLLLLESVMPVCHSMNFVSFTLCNHFLSHFVVIILKFVKLSLLVTLCNKPFQKAQKEYGNLFATLSNRAFYLKVNSRV